MKKITKSKTLTLMLVLGVAVSGSVLNASSFTKTLKAAYNNIGISYNGQTKTLSAEPFIVDGTTYVPLRAIGEVMGSTVSWADNTVYITDQTAANVSSEAEIAAKNFEIASLKQQLDLANSELVVYKDGATTTGGENLTTTAVKTTLEEIEYDYDEEYDIDWTFDLRIVSSGLELTVYYSSRYDDIFDDMTSTQRKAFIKAICSDIAYNHDGVEIRGTLEDEYKDREAATFKYSSSGTFTYEEEEAYSLSDLEDDLAYYYDEIDCFGFDIPITSIELEEEYDDELGVTINVNLGSYSSYWDELTSSDEDDLEYFIEDIIDDIEDKVSVYDTIRVYIKDSTYGTIAIYRNGYVTIY